MKRILIVLLTAVMLVSFTACGIVPTVVDDNSTDLQSEEQNDVSSISEQIEESKPEESKEDDELTLAEALGVYGFTEEDFKPEGFTEHNTYSLMGKAGVIQNMLSFNVKVEDVSAENAKLWYSKLFDKLITLSDTDKVYKDMQGGQEFADLEDVLASSNTLTDIPSFACYYPSNVGENRAYLQFKVAYSPEDSAYSVFIWLMNYLR